jgi:nucleoside-diphosphate-sugar epimerase
LRFGATCDAEELIDPHSVFARWLFLREARAFLAAQPARSLAQDETLRILDQLDDGSDALVALADLDGNPEIRQWGDARDVAEGCLLTLGNERADGEIFDLGGAPPFTTLELATYIGKRTNRPVVLAPVPTARPPWYLSSQKAIELLGYAPAHSIFAMVDEALGRPLRPRE